MKTLVLNQKNYQREECCTGKINYKLLPSQIILAANYLKENNKDVVFIDEQIQKVPDLNEFDIIVTWISILNGFFEDIKILKKAKEMGKKTIAVLNDPHGIELEVMQEFKFIDICIRLSEREITLNKVISHWEEKNEKLDFPGVIYRHNNILIDTGTMPFLKDLTHLKSSAGLISELPLSQYDEAFITTGRGCPMLCTFCSYPATASRKRNIPDIMEEIKIVSSEIDYYSFIDLNLYANKQWAENFLAELKNRKFNGNWVGDMRAEQASIELLTKWKEAGCRRILMGIESFDNESLIKMKKGITQDTIIKAMRNMQKVDINPITSLIVGLPWDSDETLEKTETFIKKYGITLYGTNYLVPVRGTKIYEDAKSLGLIKKDLTVHDYVNAPEYPVIPSLYLDREEIVEWGKRLQKIRFDPVYMLNYVKHNGFKPRYIKSFFGRIKNYYNA